ncbi:MAG: hypothetical protein AAF533_24380 [Acidobacteriota bacterium]
MNAPELDWLRARARSLAERQLASLEPDALDADGSDDRDRLVRHTDVHHLLAQEFFRAGLYLQSAEHCRERERAETELTASMLEEGDEAGAKEEEEELARHAWMSGDLVAFRRYVSEGCEPGTGVSPRLDVFPSLFLAWAVLQESFHPEWWSDRFEEAVESKRRELRRHYLGTQGEVAEGVLVDSVMAASSFWHGQFDRALREAQRAQRAWHRFGSARPEGLRLTHKRVSRLRIDGLVALLEGRDQPERLTDAIRCFARALDASAQTRFQEWKDLVCLHLCARAWADDDDALITEFVEHFGHLEHVLARQRQWRPPDETLPASAAEA